MFVQLKFSQQILTAAELQICLLLTALGVDNEGSLDLSLTLGEQQLQRVKVEGLAHLTDAGWADRAGRASHAGNSRWATGASF